MARGGGVPHSLPLPNLRGADSPERGSGVFGKGNRATGGLRSGVMLFPRPGSSIHNWREAFLLVKVMSEDRRWEGNGIGAIIGT